MKTSPPLDELTKRRRELRHRRRWRLVQGVWQLLAVSGLTASLLVLATSSAWVISKPTQVRIIGNHEITTEALYRILNFRYPESILQVQPRALEQALLAQAPLAQASVTRRLWPPEILVTVREKTPVALTLPGPVVLARDLSPLEEQPGILDDQGVWLPLTALQAQAPKPDLTVVGIKPQDLRYWKPFYAALRLSQVKVTQVDWRNPENLILTTSLGLVYLGPYDGQVFPQQIHRLNQLVGLPRKVPLTKFSYLDLRNPNLPTLQLNLPHLTKSPSPARPRAPHD